MRQETHVEYKKRLLERALLKGTDSLLESEYIEALLFLAMPSQNVRNVAQNLYNSFGSFDKVIDANPMDLLRFPGMNTEAALIIKSVKEFSMLYLRERISITGKDMRSRDLVDYCCLSMAHLKNEQLCVAFFNSKGLLVDIATIQTGTIDHSVIYPREIVRHALDRNATSLIIVHNHPNGPAEPSKADIDITRKLYLAATTIDIVLQDHIIVSKGGHYSFSEDGLMERITSELPSNTKDVINCPSSVID